MTSGLSEREKKRLQEKSEQIFAEMMEVDAANKVCADCGVKGPRWASWNIGCFLCIRCGGLHRKMGTHISKVKSISLDTWTLEMLQECNRNMHSHQCVVQHFQSLGNTKCNALYNPRQDVNRPASDRDLDMENFVRDKYERKVFMDVSANASKDNSSSQLASNKIKYKSELQTLNSMGFTNVEQCIVALQRTNNVPQALDYLLTQSQTNSEPVKSVNSVSSNAQNNQTMQSMPSENLKNQVDQNVYRRQMLALKQMGFEDEQKNWLACQQTNGRVDKAAELLKSSFTQHSSHVPNPNHQANINPFGATNDPWANSTAQQMPPSANIAQISNSSNANDLFGLFDNADSGDVANNATQKDLPLAYNFAQAENSSASKNASNKDFIMSMFNKSPQAQMQTNYPNSNYNNLNTNLSNNNNNSHLLGFQQIQVQSSPQPFHPNQQQPSYYAHPNVGMNPNQNNSNMSFQESNPFQNNTFVQASNQHSNYSLTQNPNNYSSHLPADKNNKQLFPNSNNHFVSNHVQQSQAQMPFVYTSTQPQQQTQPLQQQKVIQASSFPSNFSSQNFNALSTPSNNVNFQVVQPSLQKSNSSLNNPFAQQSSLQRLSNPNVSSITSNSISNNNAISNNNQTSFLQPRSAAPTGPTQFSQEINTNDAFASLSPHRNAGFNAMQSSLQPTKMQTTQATQPTSNPFGSDNPFGF